MAKKKTAVLIDAGYLKKISTHLGNGNPLKIDIIQFSRYLATKVDLWAEQIFYYDAPPFQSNSPTNDESRRKAGYDKFVSSIRGKGVIVREGRCQKIDGEFCQKGVDTWVVMDLMNLALSDKYETIILLACDTDFVPIINDLEKKGIHIQLYFYTDRVRKSAFSMSNEILDACKRKTLLDETYFTKNLMKKT